MSLIEETIDATLDSNGQLQLSQQPSLPPGPVRVTIRRATAPKASLADVCRDIRAGQIARRFQGLTTEQLRQLEADMEAEDDEYDREMERARALPPSASGAP